MQIQWNKQWMIPSGVGIASFGAGVGVGYILFLRKLRSMEVEHEEKVEEIETNLMELNFDNNIIDMQAAEREIISVPEKGKAVVEQLLNGQPVDDEIVLHEVDVQSVGPVLHNVFPEVDDDWNYEVEMGHRETLDPKSPYVIHIDEFTTGESGYRQSTLTYYKGDNVLVDEREEPVYNVSSVIGEANFGHGSRDPNVVYVRNDALQAEYEVILHTGHYLVEVLGQQMEDEFNEDDIKHSVGVRKFRPD